MRPLVLRCSLLFVVIVAGCETDSIPSMPAAAVTAPERIAVLGDSLAVSPSRAESFPAVLQTRLNVRSDPWIVTNAGRRGDTTSGGLRRLDAVLAERPRILVVALGANDGLRGVDVPTIVGNLSEIIERAQARGVSVLLCGMETPPLRGWNYMMAFHRIFPDVARKYDVPLVPFLLANVALNRDLNGEDFIHPNAAGARQIAETIWPYLEPLVIAAASQTD